MSKRSAVWKYFEKNNDGTSTCVLCYKKLKTSGNTTNLNGHLISMHKSIINQKTHDSNKQDVADDPGEAINTSVPNTDNVITLPLPYQNFKRQTNIKQSFNNISTYTEGGVKDSKITNLIVYMISKDNQPISIVEDKGFKLLIKSLAPLYKMPSRRNVSRKIDVKYEALAGIFKETLSISNNFSLTTDIWTDIQTRSYLGITVHFANTSTFTLKSGILGVYDLSERHTSDYIAVKLKEACFEWEIPMNSVTAVITDGANNMTKSIELAFGRNHQIPCFAHTINLIAERSLSNVAELTKLISNVKSIVTWFKHSVVGSDDLRKLTGGDGKLIQEVSTRWNSTFYMLQRFISLRPFVNEILNKNIKAPEMISAQSVLDITEVIEVLKPLEAATRELCGEFYVTSSVIIPMTHLLYNKINQTKTTTIISSKLKVALLEQCQKRFECIESVTQVAIATILDPRFKKIYFKSSIALSRALSIISDTLKTSTDQVESIPQPDLTGT